MRHLAEVHGLPRREATARASDALWQVGLGEERFRPLGTMSTGQRQRVKLAQAIAHDPALVLLDEPTDGLDPVQRDEMLELIRRIGTEFGIDVLLSSHLLDEVERICDAAVILGDGGVVAAGTLDELARRGPTASLVEVDERPTSSWRRAHAVHGAEASRLDGRAGSSSATTAPDRADASRGGVDDRRLGDAARSRGSASVHAPTRRSHALVASRTSFLEAGALRT